MDQSVNLYLAASLGDNITNTVADVAEALRYPVLILALGALLLVAYELGRLGVEVFQRSQRSKERFDVLARSAQQHALAGDSAAAQALLNQYAYGKDLQRAAIGTMFAADPVDAQRAVVDYDIYVSRRLDRVRLLVRSGPALGLMGTLIPLAPALAALGKGDSKVLADELQTAFAITVIGVLIGLVAFAVALFRERFYTKDLADLEFLREIRGDAGTAMTMAAAAPTPAMAASGQGSDVSDAPTIAAPQATMDASAPHAAPTPVAPTFGVPAAPAAPPTAAGKSKRFGIKRKGAASTPVAPESVYGIPAVPAAPVVPPPPPAPAPGAFPPPPPLPSTPPPAPAVDAGDRTWADDKSAAIPDAPEPPPAHESEDGES